MIRKKMIQLERELNQTFLEREEIIRGLLVAMIAKGNLLILGPPGTGKTALAETLCNQLNAQFFSRLLTKVSAPEELFGSLSLKALENDIYRRVTTGRLPEADVAVIDEIFKSSSAILNTLLPILNERVYFDDQMKATPIPLQILVGLSNEMPDGGAGGELAALWDRFDLRYITGYIKEERNFASMLTINTSKTFVQVTLFELAMAQQEALASKITNTMITILVRLWKELRNQGFVISDRRFRNCLRFLKAHAWLEGRGEVTEEDLVILTPMLWTEPEQMKQIYRTVLGFANPFLVKANEIVDGAFEVQAKLKDMADGSERTTVATEANHKLKVAQKLLDGLLKQARSEGKATSSITERMSQVKKMNEEVVNTYLLGL